ncbi:MAG TPA: hypothetical protein VF815_05615 [Myxococcaceae bacterium]
MARLILFCESPADASTVQGLVERVIREEGPDWLRDLLDGPAEGAQQVLDWVPDNEGRSFFDLHGLSAQARRLGLRIPQGHFDGKPGAAGALMARTAFHVARELALAQEGPEAVLLVWDMDDQGEERRQGLEQARQEAGRLVPFVLLLGCPDPMREAWVLAGFEPETDEEHSRLVELRQELGFHPCQEAHRLDAKKEHARRSPKRVLDALTSGAREREVRCWTAAPLSVMRERGRHSGLAAFLNEVTTLLLPKLTGGS